MGTRQKLSDEVVAEIRTRWKTGKFTQFQLAIETGVHPGHISRIVNAKTRSNQPAVNDVLQRIYDRSR